MVDLTPDAIRTIFFEEGEAHTMIGAQVQIVTMKKVQQNGANPNAPERWRLCISDGKHFLAAMLATQLNGLVSEGHLRKGTIIKLNNYICNTVRERKIAIILELAIVSNDNPAIIGDPQNFDGQAGTALAAKHAEVKPTAPQQYQPPQHPTKPAYNNNSSSYGGPARVSPSPGRSGTTVPIKTLNCYQNRWSIKGRCVQKGDYRHWNNDKGQGKLINIKLTDDSGTIRITAFNDVAEKLFETVRINHVYVFSGGEVKFANAKYNDTGHPCEVTLNKSSVIEEVSDDEVPPVHYQFVKIGTINDQPKDAVIDVIGVCTTINDCVTIQTRAGSTVTKRDVTIQDDSNKSINLTMWGAVAETFDYQSGIVLAVSGARVGDYNGRTLSASSTSMVLPEPDIPDAHRLRGWYDSAGKDIATESLSAGGGGMATRWDDDRMSLGALRDSQASMTAQPVYFITNGYIDVMRKENFIYNACPSCNKKVLDTGNGYRCEACQKDYQEASKRLMLSVCVYDAEGSQWVTAFHDTAEQMLGMSAEDLSRLSQNDSDAFDAKLNECQFKHMTFKLRAKLETYQDEAKIRCNIGGVKPVDFRAESKRLLTEINKLMSVA
eukprot:CFRG0499T1